MKLLHPSPRIRSALWLTRKPRASTQNLFFMLAPPVSDYDPPLLSSSSCVSYFSHLAFVFLLTVETGTTTLQKFLQKKDIQDLLASENITVLRHDVMHQHGLLTKQHGDYRFSASFDAVMRTERNRSPHNLFGSSEYLANLAPGMCEAWRKVTSKKSKKLWKIQVVLVYRRFYDMLPSLWNQLYKLRRRPGENPSPRRDWPGIDGETRIMPMNAFVSKRMPKNASCLSCHLTYRTYQKWKECSEEITILNFHRPHVELEDGTTIEDDLLAFFVCQGIRAQGACSHLVKERAAFQKKERSKNLSAKLDYGILADYAYENGFVGNFSRPTVELAIRKFINGPLQTAAPPQLTFAMKCPGPEVLRGLYHLSLEAEEWAQHVMESTGHTTYVQGGRGRS